ncbi:amidohydrolase [Acidipila sp. EB88]|uniref:amidohydrolase family protein n=1 Tax=Acidipila sp. EB88 TaxID=2305226 RepID=UPI000F5FB9B3|nr:amidohydrolase family protein [Acidipila sp. EB88]RRA49185.1 amidohydrolase [Acidipila sp. EB88]
MLNRRRFVERGLFASCAALGTLASRPLHAATSGTYSGRIVDTHVHLFDPTRPGGIPWPLPGDLIDEPTLPARYEAMAQSLGVVGAIAIEASPLVSDNDWLLGVVASSPIMVGMIGDIVPTAPDFDAQLDRLRMNPLFLGVRHGNLWNRSLSADTDSPLFWTAMRQLSEAKLVLESANPDLPLLAALLKVVEKEPTLTVVIDHLPHLEQPSTAQEQRRAADLVAQLGKAPHTFAKLSEIPEQAKGQPVLDPAVYRKRLDRLWSAFGPDKLMFGSDWPNSDHVASFDATLGLVKQYVSTQHGDAQEKFFFRNSKAAYRWHAKTPSQL